LNGGSYKPWKPCPGSRINQSDFAAGTGPKRRKRSFRSSIPDAGQRKPGPGSNPADPSETDGAAHGTWSREGNVVTIIVGEGHEHRQGNYYPQTQTIILTLKSPNGEEEQTYVPYQQSAGAPAPRSGGGAYDGAYALPSAPAQQAAPAQSRPNPAQQLADALKPPLQNGTYGCAGTKETIQIAGTAKSGMLWYKKGRGITK
jgi:hypothetical protein